MLDIKAILATLAGLVVVGGVGTYVYLENSTPEDGVIQVNTNPAISALENSQDEASPETPANIEATPDAIDEAESSEEEVAALSTSEEPTKDWTVPAFDVLRVEPDGSTVIAGKGQPNTTLKVMNGNEVLNEVKIGSSGDFAVIFDQPLDSGDYQLTLKVEDEDGNALVSEETAIVSVPEELGGQLLAMITEPGKASRILAQPESPAQAASEESQPVVAEETATEAEEVKIASNTPSNEVEVEVENTEVANASDTQVEADASEEMVETASDVTKVQSKQDDTVKTADNEAVASDNADVVADAGDQASDVVENTVAKEAEIAKEAVTDANKESAADEVKEAVEEVMETAETDEVVEDAVKNADAASQDAMEKTADEAVAEVQPENDSTVRIEAVEVEGNKLFVAGTASKGNTVRILVDGNEVGAVDVNADGRFLMETEQELTVGSHMITAALEDKATKEIVLRAVVPFIRPEAESAAAVASAGADGVSEEATAAEEEVASNDATNQNSDGDENAAAAVADSSDSMTALKEENSVEVAETMVKDEAVETVSESEPETIVQDTLTPAASQSVIIRKGDTLWQIARRTYGAGVRYTTIYLANEEQIDNPDKIEPGQIFAVPEEALENAEELHKQRLQQQN